LQTKIHDFTNEFRLCRALWVYYIDLIWGVSGDRLDKMDFIQQVRQIFSLKVAIISAKLR